MAKIVSHGVRKSAAHDLALSLDPWVRDTSGGIDVESMENCHTVLRMSGVATVRMDGSLRTKVTTESGREFSFRNRKDAAMGMCEFAQKQFGFFPRVRIMGRALSDLSGRRAAPDTISDFVKD